MELTKDELELLLNLHYQSGTETVIETENLKEKFDSLIAKGYITNVIDNSVDGKYSYKFNISAKGTDFIAELQKM
ncbi:hypothetical protein ACE1MS_23395 (plasmid) [Lysinibacillus sp. fkY74-1]